MINSQNLVRDALASLRAQSLQPGQAKTAALFPDRGSDDAVLFGTGDNQFRLELEKHIHDYYRGHPERSRDTARKLNQKAALTASALAPNDLSDFSGYLSIFSYGKRARYVAGVDSAIRAIQRINTAA